MHRFASSSSSSCKLIKSLPLFTLLLLLSVSSLSSQPTSITLADQNNEQLTSVQIKNNNKDSISPLITTTTSTFLTQTDKIKGVEASTYTTDGLLHELKHEVNDSITWLGTKVAGVLGFESESNYETLPPVSNGGIIGWSDSSLYVERTNSLHPSRPSSFGPRVEDPLSSLLFPITTFSTSDAYGCNSSDIISGDDLPTPPASGWIALSMRGHCPFSQKVRFAESLGAIAVIFGDQSAEDGGLGSGLASLLTPWSPDDTRDIYIPSAFVSRASYLSLLKTYEAEQTLVEEGTENEPITQDGKPRGLVVTMSADDLFSWPLLDFLLLLLFLPSMLTGLTIVTTRIRQFRERKLARAPIDAVAQLPVYIYGDLEKLVEDEENSVGLTSNESTPLLKSTSKGRSRTQMLIRFLPPLLRPIQSSIQLAPRRKLSPQFESCTECAICLSDFEKGDKVLILPCNHIFHQEEIVAWLIESKRLCPTCRASITVDEQEVEAVVLAPTAATSIPPARNPILQNLDRVASPVASSSSVTIESALVTQTQE